MQILSIVFALPILLAVFCVPLRVSAAESSRPQLCDLRETNSNGIEHAPQSSDPGSSNTHAVLTQIGVGQAQIERGQYRTAAKQLEAALNLARTLQDEHAVAAASAALGNAYIALGPPEDAEQCLRSALVLARKVGDRSVAAAASNDLGNFYVTQQRRDDALTAYRDSIALASAERLPLLGARAQINAANVMRDQGEGRDALAQYDAALRALRELRASAIVASSLVSAGLGYRALREALPIERARLTTQAANVLSYAARTAEQAGDRRSASYAFGYLGELYAEAERRSEALELMRKAVTAAQQSDAPESLYRWQWKSARLLEELGEHDNAIDSYRRAVATLQQIRPELSVSYAAPTVFRESAGQVYLELVDLLLQRSHAGDRVTVTGPALIEARQTMELFKVAELRDYFRDDCVDAALSKVTSLEAVAKTAVVVYPILLADRMELLVSLPSGLKSVVVPVGRDEMGAEVLQFRRLLEKVTTREYLPHARRLYSWLIAPIEQDLQRAGIETLVFVPDGPLRTVPMAALHDGKQFLVAKYAVAVTPGLNLTDPRPLRRERTKALAVGVTEAVQGYAALPNVADELNALSAIFDSTTLLDRQFVADNLERELKAEPFNILHVASHGEFGGTPATTFILTFDRKLTMDQLDQYIGLFKYRDAPLELLTLSACETAAGDDRAALGIAGVAVRAGARSAVATLWQVHDRAAADLLSDFYRQLRDETVSRAVALQRAQLKIIEDPRFAHPGYWSPFLMINNWL